MKFNVQVVKKYHFTSWKSRQRVHFTWAMKNLIKIFLITFFFCERKQFFRFLFFWIEILSLFNGSRDGIFFFTSIFEGGNEWTQKFVQWISLQFFYGALIEHTRECSMRLREILLSLQIHYVGNRNPLDSSLNWAYQISFDVHLTLWWR